MNTHPFATNSFINYPLLQQTPHDQLIKIVEGEFEFIGSELDKLLSNPTNHTFDILIPRLDHLWERMNLLCTPISHLNSNDSSFYQLDAQITEMRSTFIIKFNQNSQYYKVIKALIKGKLTEPERRCITQWLRGFEQCGIHLSESDQQKFKQLTLECQQKQLTFEHNITESRNDYHIVILDKKELEGVAEDDVEIYRQNSEFYNTPGYVITLEASNIEAALSSCSVRETRQKVYRAACTIGSAVSPHSGRFDNTVLQHDILTIRNQIASLMGYKTSSDMTLRDNMISTAIDVKQFLNKFDPVYDKATEELNNLREFARNHLGIDNVQMWDRMYIMEQMSQHFYNVSMDEIVQYFQAQHVLPQTLKVIERIFNIQFVLQDDSVPTWHESVDCYAVMEQGVTLGHILIDLYERDGKRGGAWMTPVNTRYKDPAGTIHLPSAYVSCNFVESMSLDDIETLFHEMGHALHQVLTKQTLLSISCINGVAEDAIELPSQVMEYWCGEREVLQLLSKHKTTGETLPDALYDNMIKDKTFNIALHMIRQLEMSMFDICIHSMDYNDPDQIYKELQRVRQKYYLIPYPEFNRFAHAFSHIFGGDYDSNYYSYLWSDVLSADAFSVFRKNGVFDQYTASLLKKHIFEIGGSKDINEAFKQFVGRAPEIGSLLKELQLD